MSELKSGIYYFGTISAVDHYSPSVKMWNHLLKTFKEVHHIVIEYGENGKSHMHFIGLSTSRTDNLKNAIRKILVFDNIDVSNYTLDLRPEPNISWRLGYLQKEEHARVLSTTFSEITLEQGRKDYSAKPKRDRGLKQDACMTFNQLAEYMEEGMIRDRFGVLEALRVLKYEGRINFAFFQKLNVKKLILYVTEQFDD